MGWILFYFGCLYWLFFVGKDVNNIQKNRGKEMSSIRFTKENKNAFKMGQKAERLRNKKTIIFQSKRITSWRLS